MKKVSQDMLIGTWWRLNEAEKPSSGIMIWRKEGAHIPVSRGRHSIVLDKNGQCIFRPVGPNDAPRALPGTWQLSVDKVIEIRLPSGQLYDWRLVKKKKDEIWVGYNE